MAEIFGTITGALNVAALFNNCVECFEYIQLGRHFGRDYETCQLKLDIAMTRLSRWGQAVDINSDAHFATDSPDDKRVQLAQSILEQIVLLFQSSQKTSKRYEMTAEQQDLVLYSENDMGSVSRGWHNRLWELVRRGRKSTGLVKKTAWALYDGKAFERMVNQIKDFVDELEKVFPVESACRRLAEIEIEEVEDEPRLAVLRDAAEDVDPVLAGAVAEKVQTIAGRNSANEVKVEERARIQVGSRFSEAVLVRGIAVTDRTENSVDRAEGKGDARIQIGNRYGGTRLDD